MKYTRIAYISIAYLKRKNKRLSGLTEDYYYVLVRCNRCNRYIMNEYCMVKGKGRQYRHQYFCLKCAISLYPKKFVLNLLKEHYKKLQRFEYKYKLKSAMKSICQSY